jgi:formate hydrogenlyase subunit 3/multisubunit Na+/H+ antiporter MnhD subunit
MNFEHAVFAPVYLPLLGAAIAFCAKAFFKRNAVRILEYAGVCIGLFLPFAVLAGTLPLVLSGGSVSGVVGGWHPAVGIAYRFDGLAWLVNFLGYAVAAAAWVYSLHAGPKGPAFSAVFLIQTASLAAAIMTADLFNLFVALEVLGIASYVLVASSSKPGASLAAFSYLMVSATAMVFFLLGLFGFYRLTGSLSYSGIAAALQELPDGGGSEALISLALVTAAVAMRVAVMPLYGWLPDAHAKAPHAISAVLSGVLIKTPLFALMRVLAVMPAGQRAGELMGYAGALTALAGVIIALSQKDAKRLLAYHSISQIGYIVAAWGAALAVGPATDTGLVLLAAAFLHALYHALFKGLLFLSVGTTTDAAGERDVYHLRRAGMYLKARGERLPVTLFCFAVGALAISAVPPLNGYVSKQALTYALKGSWQAALLSAASVGTAASFIKLSRIFWPSREAGERAVPAAEAGTNRAALWVSELFLASLCIAGGLAAPRIYPVVIRLLSETPGLSTPLPPLYSAAVLGKTALTVAGGALLFFAVSTSAGAAVLKRIRERPRGFQGLFLSFAFGTAALALWLVSGS